MKIAFDLDSLKKGKYCVARDSSKCSDVSGFCLDDSSLQMLKMLSESGHQLYLFSDSSAMAEKQKEKKCRQIVKKLKVNGIKFSNVAFVDDFRLALGRNYIDIAVSNREGLKDIVPTDLVNYNGKNHSQGLNDVLKTIDDNHTFLHREHIEGKMPSDEQLWLKSYRTGDFKWSDTNMSPYDRLISATHDWPNAIAMEYYGRKITNAEFVKMVDKLADVMANDGIKKGMKVPLVVANTPDAFVTLYALYKIKATITPIFPMATEETFKSVIEKIDADNKKNGFSTTIFMSDIVCDRFKNSILDDSKIVTVECSNFMPIHKKVIFDNILKKKLGIKPVKYNKQVISWNDYIDSKVDKKYNDDTSFDDSYPAVQLYTGGTIKPKAVLLSEGNLDAAAKQFYNDRFDFCRGDKIAAFMPLNHSFGLIIGTHVALTLGITLDVIMKLNFKKIDELFTKSKINIFGGIPNMFPSIYNNPKLAVSDLSHVKYVLSGGSALDPTIRENTNSFFKAHNSEAAVEDGYGLTEVAGGAIYNGIPNIGLDVKIVAPGTIDELGYEQKGELCLSGPQIMLGYDDEALTTMVLKRHADGKMWLHTGDIAYVSKDSGRVVYVDRADRVIKVNGEQVALSDLEEKINTLAFVENSAVVKKKDDIRGFVPVAFIKLKPGYEWSDSLEEMMQSFYNEQFTSFTKPRFTKIVTDFPKTAVGKVDFKTLELMANTNEFESAKIKARI